jgi:hypothetical protein
LKSDRHALDDAAGAGLDCLDVPRDFVAEGGDVGVELGFGTGALHYLGEECLDGSGALHHGAEGVEALDVAGALPDRS